MAKDDAPTRQRLLRVELSARPVVACIEIARVELAPGQAAGRHLHPCPVAGQVIEGAIRFQIEGEAESELNRGDAFYEPQGVVVVRFDNASDTEPAIFSAFYLLAPGEERLIEMLAG